MSVPCLLSLYFYIATTPISALPENQNTHFSLDRWAKLATFWILINHGVQSRGRFQSKDQRDKWPRLS